MTDKLKEKDWLCHICKMPVDIPVCKNCYKDKQAYCPIHPRSMADHCIACVLKEIEKVKVVQAELRVQACAVSFKRGWEVGERRMKRKIIKELIEEIDKRRSKLVCNLKEIRSNPVEMREHIRQRLKARIEETKELNRIIRKASESAVKKNSVLPNTEARKGDVAASQLPAPEKPRNPNCLSCGHPFSEHENDLDACEFECQHEGCFCQYFNDGIRGTREITEEEAAMCRCGRERIARGCTVRIEDSTGSTSWGICKKCVDDLRDPWYNREY